MSDTAPKFSIDDDAPKRSPGRPKGSTAANKLAATATPADVKKAMATLESAYNLVATGLTLFGLEKSAEDWINSAEQLARSNEDALKASPALAKRIASAGSTGGAATFLVTHAMAFASLAGVLRSELADKRADTIIANEGIPSDPTEF